MVFDAEERGGVLIKADALETGEAVLRIRWATWYPVPYWTDRFNALAKVPRVDLEVIFTQSSQAYYEFRESASWGFRHRFLSRSSGPLGFYRPRLLPRNPAALIRHLRATRLVLSYADPTWVVAAALARARGHGYHLFVANTLDDNRSRARLFELSKRWIFRNASQCLVTGPLQAEYVRNYTGSVPITVIGNPVDVSRLLANEPSAQRRQRGRQRWKFGGKQVIGFVGRLAYEKDLPTLIRAAAACRARGHSVTVAFAGSGPMADQLARLASEVGVDATFVGFLEGHSLGDFYAALDAFCLPSTSEPWGLVVNEAMALGLPVIVSDRVGARSLIEQGKSGLVFRAGDAESLSATVSNLFDESGRGARIGRAAQDAIKRESITAWVSAVVSALSWPPAAVGRRSGPESLSSGIHRGSAD